MTKEERFNRLVEWAEAKRRFIDTEKFLLIAEIPEFICESINEDGTTKFINKYLSDGLLAKIEGNVVDELLFGEEENILTILDIILKNDEDCRRIAKKMYAYTKTRLKKALYDDFWQRLIRIVIRHKIVDELWGTMKEVLK